MKSRFPLKEHDPHLPMALAKWAKQRPDHDLAGAARGPGAAVAQGVLCRSQAHRRRADPGAAESEAAGRPPGHHPVGQFDRARADDDGGDAGADSDRAGVAGLFADEPGSSEAEISVRSGEACGRCWCRTARSSPRRCTRWICPACRWCMSAIRPKASPACRSPTWRRRRSPPRSSNRSRGSRPTPSPSCCSRPARPGCRRR